jgi:hypothetical protein
MSFTAHPNKDWKDWDYLLGNLDMSIVTERYYHLMDFSFKYDKDFKVALHDPHTGAWTKWQAFPHWMVERSGSSKWNRSWSMSPAYDVHRSVVENEIVIESDYPEYEDNAEAARIIGAILEKKGFIPHYYYSGNKSIHIHVYLKFAALLKADMLLQDQIVQKYKTRGRFIKAFMTWLRGLMIRCWDTGIREFDEQLVHPTHLIRSEMSKNKLGYKTFLGYTHKDLSFIPYVCNEKNKIYPKLGKIKESEDFNAQELLEEFMAAEDRSDRRKKVKRREANLMKWLNPGATEGLRGCVKWLLSDDFKERGDGFHRAMFILANELKRILGPAEALAVLKDWNKRMDFPIKEEDMEYRMTLKNYTLSCDYIHSFIKGLGFDVSEKCKSKIYK